MYYPYEIEEGASMNEWMAEHGEIRFTVFGAAQPAGSKRAMHHKQSGKIIVLDSNPKSSDWKKIVGYTARQSYVGEVLTGPLAVTLRFYQPRPQGHYGTGRNASVVKASAANRPTGRPDVLKLARAVEDGLTGVVWRDDAQIVQESLEKQYGEPARVEISIRPLT
jgi:Holliday junction resolvase RusA-like endonuclease